MNKSIEKYWDYRLKKVKNNLEKNRFEVFIAPDKNAAKDIALDEIIPSLTIKSVSWGGSMSFVETGLFHVLKKRKDIEVINTFDKTLLKADLWNLRKKSLTADLFITGTNALTLDGRLVNLDMIGNRVAAMILGPEHVLLIIGRNKICENLDDAMKRVKHYASVTNSMRLGMKVPCAKTGECQDCSSPERICNYWTIIDKSFIKNRIKIILVNQDLGL